jgi:hypothetical protein
MTRPGRAVHRLCIMLCGGSFFTSALIAFGRPIPEALASFNFTAGIAFGCVMTNIFWHLERKRYDKAVTAPEPDL